MSPTHKLNLKVVAEGVENTDQKEFLEVNKCGLAQGFLFSKPLSFEELYRFLLKPNKAELALESA